MRYETAEPRCIVRAPRSRCALFCRCRAIFCKAKGIEKGIRGVLRMPFLPWDQIFNSTVNTVPFPGSLSTRMQPPDMSTIFFARAMPSPFPSEACEVSPW